MDHHADTDIDANPQPSLALADGAKLCRDNLERELLFARVQAFKNIYVNHPQVVAVEKDLESLLTYGKAGTVNGSAYCYLLTGEPGWGKSTLLRNFAARHKVQIMPEGNVRPVVYVELKGTAKRKDVAERLLTALGASYPGRASERELMRLVLHHLRAQKVNVLVLDEAQTFVDQETLKFSYASAEWLKGILNEGACALVFAGMPAARAIYDLDEQLQRRSFGSRELGGFDRQRDSEMEMFRFILHHLLDNAPLKHELEVGRELELAFHASTHGRVGMLVDFIVKACIFAAGEGRAVIGLQDLVEAADRLRPLSDRAWRNPFSLDWVDLLAEMARVDEARQTGGVRLNLRRGKRKPRMSDVFVD